MKKILFILLAAIIWPYQSLSLECPNDSEQMKIQFKNTTVEKEKRLVYVDGKLFDFDIKLIDPNKIESIRILKDDESKKKYNAPNGLYFIKTKKLPKKRLTEKAEPLIIIDNIKSTREDLSALKPQQIDSMSVIKGEVAIKKYNSKGGVILIKLKDKK